LQRGLGIRSHAFLFHPVGVELRHQGRQAKNTRCHIALTGVHNVQILHQRVVYGRRRFSNGRRIQCIATGTGQGRHIGLAMRGPHQTGTGIANARRLYATHQARRARAREAALVVVKAPGGRVPQAAHVHSKVCRLYALLVARAHQAVRREHAHQNAHAKNVVGVEAATVGGDCCVISHRGILDGGYLAGYPRAGGNIQKKPFLHTEKGLVFGRRNWTRTKPEV
jgi:hypothetical protein